MEEKEEYPPMGEGVFATATAVSSSKAFIKHRWRQLQQSGNV